MFTIDHAPVAGDVRVIARGDDEGRAVEDAIGIEGDGALEEVVARVAIQQRGGVDQDEALLRVGDVEERVERVDGLLFVFGIALARGVHAERGRARRSSARPSSSRRSAGRGATRARVTMRSAKALLSMLATS